MDKARYLFPSDYMADPSANVFNGRLYIYPSHDWDSGEAFDDDGGHFQMKDYHVLSLDDVENGEVTDHGQVLAVEDIPWASRQLWDNDVVEKDGKYYMVYCAKDKNGVFHLGIAIADRPSRGPIQAPGRPYSRLLLNRPLRVQGRRRSYLYIFRRHLGRTVAALQGQPGSRRGASARRRRAGSALTRGKDD